MINIDEIKRNISIENFAQKYNLHINRNGFMPCIFHDEKTASLKVYSDSARGFYCFGCHKGGNIINFAMQYYEMDFKNTIQQLANEFGMNTNYNYRNYQNRIARDRFKAERIKGRQTALNRAVEHDLLIARHRQLLKNFIDYAPDMDDLGNNPFFVDACHELARVEYELDVLEGRNV